MRRWISLIAVIIVVAGIFYLTLQKPAETGALTETARSWLGIIGINVEAKPLRHYIHYVMYLPLGLAVCGFCVDRSIPLRIGLIAGCGIGMLDEALKVLLPTREFDVTDLLRDVVGVGVAVAITASAMKRSRNNNRRPS